MIKYNRRSQFSKYICYFIAVLLIGFVFYLVFKQIENYEKQDDPMLDKLKDKFSRFFNQDKYWTGNLSMLNDKNVMDEIKIYRGNKSYTINKEKVYMCLKDDKGEYYSLNMLTYVLAHELAHVLCKSIGHTQEFHEIFEQLLYELSEAGVYDPEEEILEDYCEHGDDSY